MGTGRLEAFSDGVFAIAIALLILTVDLSHAESGPLAERLLQLWPSYVAYGVSFLTIGIMWANDTTSSARSDEPTGHSCS